MIIISIQIFYRQQLKKTDQQLDALIYGKLRETFEPLGELVEEVAGDTFLVRSEKGREDSLRNLVSGCIKIHEYLKTLSDALLGYLVVMDEGEAPNDYFLNGALGFWFTEGAYDICKSFVRCNKRGQYYCYHSSLLNNVESGIDFTTFCRDDKFMEPAIEILGRQDFFEKHQFIIIEHKKDVPVDLIFSDAIRREYEGDVSLVLPYFSYSGHPELSFLHYFTDKKEEFASLEYLSCMIDMKKEIVLPDSFRRDIAKLFTNHTKKYADEKQQAPLRFWILLHANADTIEDFSSFFHELTDLADEKISFHFLVFTDAPAAPQQGRRLENYLPDFPFHEFYKQSVGNLVENLEENELDIVAMFYCLGKIANYWDIEDMLVKEGNPRPYIAGVFEKAVAQGVILPSYVPISHIFEILNNRLYQADFKFGSFLREKALACAREGKIFCALEFIKFILSTGEESERSEYLFWLVYWSSRLGFKDTTLLKIKQTFDLASFVGLKEKQLIEVFKKYADLTARNWKEAVEEIHYFDAESFIEDDLVQKAVDTFNLLAAQINAFNGFIDGAVRQTKNILYKHQDLNVSYLTSASYRYLGHLFLKKNKLKEALEYYVIATEVADRDKFPNEYVDSLLSCSVGYYLLGDLTEAMKHSERTLQLLLKMGSNIRSLFIRFLMGRIHSDFGRYDLAVKIFADAKALAVFYEQNELQNLINVWTARVYAHSGQVAKGRAEFNAFNGHTDSMLFAAEAAIMDGDFVEAQKILLEKGSKHFQFVPLGERRFVWNSGFNHIENAALGYSGTMNVDAALSAVFLEYCRRKQEPSETPDRLRELMRSKNISENDPNYAIYMYLYSDTLPEESSYLHDDKRTTLGRAVKFLQKRATAISDSHEKNEYMYKNYWNTRLVNAARASNLL